MGTLRKNLGQRLKQLRKAAKLTQEELAAKAGMGYKYLGSVERGERNITIDNLERIIKALAVEPYVPFLFSAKDAKKGDVGDQEVLTNLIKHTGEDVRPFIINLVQAALQWSQAKKK